MRPLRDAVLKEADSSAQELIERLCCQSQRASERGVGGIPPVDMELKDFHAVNAANPEKRGINVSSIEVRGTGKRRRSVEIARLEHQRGRPGIKPLDRGRVR